MIESSDAFLIDWASSVLDDADVALELPDDTEPRTETPLVSLHLLQLSAPTRDLRTVVLEYAFDLHYLVTVSCSDLAKAHARLGQLLIAAEQHTNMNVDATPPSPDLWSALGLFPRPSFWIRVQAVYEIARPDVPLVRAPIAVRTRPMAMLHGLIVGPEDQPVAGANVRHGVNGTLVRSDRRGRFSMQVPVVAESERADGRPGPMLEVKARGRNMRVPVPDRTYSAEEPLVIQLSPRET